MQGILWGGNIEVLEFVKRTDYWPNKSFWEDKILFGRPKDYSKSEKEELYKTVLSIVRDEFGVANIPIIMNMDFGHTDPKVIMPLGCRVNINPISKEVILMENPFI